MRTTNNGGRVIRLSHYKTIKILRVFSYAAVILLTGVFFSLMKGWIQLPFPQDAGPTTLSAHERSTEIERVDFQCHVASTSVFAVTGYNPGWKFGFVSGGQAYVAFDVVGDLDLCIWSDDYTLSIDESGENLIVDVERIDVRRPRIDMNPRVLDGITYQTLKLASASEEKLANANVDRVLWEAGRNMISGDDSTYIDDMQDMLLLFGANTLAGTTCYPSAIEVMKQGVYEHFLNQSALFGFTGVEVNLPTNVSIPVVPEQFDSGQTELKMVGSETCYVKQASS